MPWASGIDKVYELMKSSMNTIDHQTDAELASLRQQLSSLAESVKQMQTQLAEQSRSLAELTARIAGVALPRQGAAATASVAAPAVEHGVNPDILVVIAAAVTAFLGKKVRIRSARMLQTPYELINPWSQQGRVSVQASHSLYRG